MSFPCERDPSENPNQAARVLLRERHQHAIKTNLARTICAWILQNRLDLCVEGACCIQKTTILKSVRC